MPPPTAPGWRLNSLMSLELLDELLSVLHVILVQPRVLLLPIAAPMHQVLSHTVSLSRLQNVLDLILRLALNQLWLWRRLWAPNDCVLVVRCKARDMEHIVDLPSCRKMQVECSIRDLLGDDKGAIALKVQLSAWAYSVQIDPLQEDLVPNPPVWNLVHITIVEALHPIGSQLQQ